MIAEGGDENGLKLDCGGACTILWIRWKSVSCTRDGWVPRHGNWTWVKCTLLTVQACPCPRGARALPTARPPASLSHRWAPHSQYPRTQSCWPLEARLQRGPPRAEQGRGLGSLQGAPPLTLTLAAETRTGGKAPAPAFWEEDSDWPGRGQQARGAL